MERIEPFEGRSADAIKTLAREMSKHRATPEQITEVIMDMARHSVIDPHELDSERFIYYDGLHGHERRRRSVIDTAARALVWSIRLAGAARRLATWPPARPWR